MSRFKPLTIGRLPRCFVNILALDNKGRKRICKELAPIINPLLKEHYLASQFEPSTMVECFRAILDFSKKERIELASKMNDVLDELLNDDFFGTEGQLDPRGDHRD